MKKIFLVHGWDSNPEKEWLPWLKRELEQKGFDVVVPEMPETDEPKIEAWVNHLKNVVGEVNENTIFVGHSIGCQTILRFLETLPESTKVGGAVFVAGWFTLQGLETEEEKEIAKPWLETPINDGKINSILKKSIAIFSTNDPVVPRENEEFFKSRFASEIVVEENKGHFTDEENITELPIVLEKILSLVSES